MHLYVHACCDLTMMGLIPDLHHENDLSANEQTCVAMAPTSHRADIARPPTVIVLLTIRNLSPLSVRAEI